jgi:hypothetical protein
MQIQLKFIGLLLMLLAFIHVFFPKYFNWKKELENLSLINKQMMQVHTFFLALTVFLMGYLCLTEAYQLIATQFGRKICLGFGFFWAIRLFFQFFVYSPKLWKGKTFETIMHVIFSLFWFYLTCFFVACWFIVKQMP